MKHPTRWYDYITINIYWFALTARSQTLTPLVVPLLVQQFVGEEAKATYYGVIRLWALMVAILTQAVMGLLSDRSTLRWGRRRPFIVAGTLGGLVVTTFMGLTSGLKGMTGYWALFGLYIFSMVASDTAHSATQGLIPDLVCEEKRGRFSGVKALLELPVPLIFVSFVIGKLVSAGDLWGGLAALMAVLVVCMLVTLLVPEQPLEEPPFALDWGVIARLALMTGAFALIILSIGELVKVMTRWLGGSSAAIALIGVAGMASAVVVGVWASVYISVGREIRRNPSFAWWVINRLAFLVAANSISGFMLYYLQERFPGLSGERAAGPATTAMMFVGICLLITALPSGWLADRIGKKLLVTLSGILAMVGMCVILTVPSLVALNVGGALIGVAMGVFFAANWALGTQIVPQEQAGRYLGLSNLAGAGAGAIGAYIGGPIADKTSYVLLFAVYGALFVLSAVSLIGIREGGGTTYA